MAGVLPSAPSAPFQMPPPTRRGSVRRRTVLYAELSGTPSAIGSVEASVDPSPYPTLSPPPGFKPPEPKRFAIRPDKLLDIFSAALALPFRLGTGAFALGYSVSLVSEDKIPSDQYAMGIAGLKLKETSKLGPRPEKPIEIYEFESCPFCRKTIVGDGTIPFMLSLGLLTTLTEGFAMIGRMGKGSFYTPSKLPPLPLELWAYEPSPYCKLVREVLVELELPHILHSTPRGSPTRQELYEKVGIFQVPYLEDHNTGVKMFESAEIIEYLRAVYAT